MIKIFIVLLTRLVHASSHTKVHPQVINKCKIQPTLINLHPN